MYLKKYTIREGVLESECKERLRYTFGEPLSTEIIRLLMEQEQLRNMPFRSLSNIMLDFWYQQVREYDTQRI